MDIEDWKEMLEEEGERHTIRNMQESGLDSVEINKILTEINELN